MTDKTESFRLTESNLKTATEWVRDRMPAGESVSGFTLTNSQTGDVLNYVPARGVVAHPGDWLVVSRNGDMVGLIAVSDDEYRKPAGPH